jgi:uncharacterized protein (TIGR01777 family)
MSERRIVVTGATGTIGRALVAALRDRGDEVVALTRNAARAREVLGQTIEVHQWPEPIQSPPPVGSLTGADAVVNLAGEPVAQRWNEGVKRAIRDSRELGTRNLVTGLHAMADGERPRTLIAGSAIGYYGPRGPEALDERARPGSDFLAEVVVAWEQEAARAEPIMRVARVRTGVVLSPRGGALAQMLPVFRLGLGGPVAGGQQYVSWIHLDDVVGGLLFCLEHENAAGPVNLVAPNPVTNAELSRALGRAVHRPAFLPVPGAALRLIYGEMGQVVTTGQRVLPVALAAWEYEFSYPELDPALSALLSAR